MSQGVAISLGCVLVGALCLVGAINQVRTGETRGATGRGRIQRTDAPGYFWYLFVVRVVLGLAALVGGLAALRLP